MRVPRRIRSAAVILAVGVCAGCSTRNLQLGSGVIGLDAGGPDAGDTGSPPSDTAPPPSDAGPPTPVTDAAESACVLAVVQLPWATAQTAARFEVVTTADAVAVLNRQAKQADVRTYRRDGTPIGGFQFSADAQFLPYSNSRFLLVARGQTGDLVATAMDPDLVGSQRLFTATATATEHILAAIAMSPMAVVAITDEHFVNISSGTVVPWSVALVPEDRDALKSGRIYGMAARTDRMMLAWGASDALRLVVINSAGSVIARAADDAFLGYLGSETTTAVPFDTGMLLFDGNPVRATQIDFDLSQRPLGVNTQLLTFSRTVARVAAISLQGRPIGFWLTVFPAADNSQGVTTHQLYACDLDLADPATCLRTAPIAATGLGGYEIAQQPVAAAAFPGGDPAFAIAHSDGDRRSWLRVADLGCARGRAP